ncbi:hypothetical protein AQJ11_37935 [Streptomyces corchorusii]|uniref:Uncharacterized protein n=1 Tax=Streptomyces corchorusii TaxID=1903 RepID=A0A101PTX3_STRCK|nr:hypothetical protein [Streptomyces corchorusii]KUN17642.1 hypothetical protein AQJ11_37935 [Streptomyces corchorusii]
MAGLGGAVAVAADADGDDLHVSLVSVEVAQGLGGDLGYGVEAVRGQRRRSVEGVQAGDVVAAGQHHARYSLAAGSLQDVVGAGDVVLHRVGERPLLVIPTRCTMADIPAAAFLGGVEVAQVGLDELDARGRPGVEGPPVEQP